MCECVFVNKIAYDSEFLLEAQLPKWIHELFKYRNVSISFCWFLLTLRVHYYKHLSFITIQIQLNFI